MLRVGLTGGIACGKTTVARMFAELGIPVLEADGVAHALLEPGQPAYAAVVAEFGPQVLRADGTVDRGRLGEIVFADRDRLERLNQLVHPGVREAIEHWFAEQAGRGARVALVEAALLVEAGYHRHLDRLIVVWCRPEQQRERLLARGLSPRQAEQRIAAQMPLEEKLRLADDVIDCSGSLEQTRRQVEALAAQLLALAAAPPG
ncbi:MAG: dephospho-CoA kinase [Acidobacteriia bacterium]|jgi:dephospho-CoA kinase|nr:dephospho-CoA kinase [Terriglobia bacterium]